MGLLGIYGESLKLTWKLRVILSQVAVTLILPLILIIFVLELVLDIHQYKVIREKLMHSSDVTLDMRILTRTQPRPQSLISERYSLVEVSYQVFILGFSLLSTAAVVYTIASSYASREISYRRIMSVVPRLWMRLAATLSCAFLTFLAFDVPFSMTFGKFRDGKLGAIARGALGLAIARGAVSVYMVSVWQMASVVTVMEDVKGSRAVWKAFRLTRGKAVVCMGVSMNLIVVLVGGYLEYLLQLNRALMNVRDSGRWSSRDVWIDVAVYGGACALLWMATMVYASVAQTVVYMVCKSYHSEEIDKSALAHHLEGIYLQGEQRRVQQVEMGEV